MSTLLLGYKQTAGARLLSWLLAAVVWLWIDGGFTIATAQTFPSPAFPPVERVYTLYEGESLSVMVTATDPDGRNQPLFPTSTLPRNASFDPMRGMFYFQPDFTQAGIFSVTFVTTDADAPSSWDSRVTLQFTVLDVSPPAVTIDSPPDGFLTRVASQRVTGTVTTQLPPTAMLVHNGVSQALTVLNGVFDTTVTLVEGVNTLRVAASNSAGTTITPEVQVLLDTLPPQLTVTTPVAPALVTVGEVQVAGTVDDPQATITVNGQRAQVNGGDWVVAPVPLQLGDNTLTIVAMDQAGNSTTLSLRLTRLADVLQAVRVTPPAIRFSIVGAQQPLTVTGILANGETVDLTTASATSYATSDVAVTTVSAAGVVTAAASGSATVTVSVDVFQVGVEVMVTPGLPQQPNFVIIMTDDQRWDTLWAMPIVQEKLVAQGVTFTNAFVTTPLCCPTRASLLAGGFYAQNTGVLTNALPNGGARKFHDTETLATLMQQAGYKTALIGKYLNAYGQLIPYVPPGWTQFVVPYSVRQWLGGYSAVIGSSGNTPTQGQILSSIPQYLTDFLAEQALAFLEQHGNSPFLLYFSPIAPHFPATPAPQDAELFDHFFYRGRAYGEVDLSDKPAFVSKGARQYSPLVHSIEEEDIFHRNYLRSLQAVDRAIGSMVAKLAAQGTLSRTVFIFTSDNGFLWGEHGMFRKGLPYEEAIRVPLVMVMPGIAPRSEEHMVAMNLDVGATLLAIAGIPTPTDGLSLLPLLQNPQRPWRDTLLLEGFNTGTARKVWAGLRVQGGGEEWKYVEYQTGEQELYDLVNDPYEEDSKHNDPDYQIIKDTLASRLAPLKGLAITTEVLPPGVVDQPYTFALTAWGGQPPYTWDIVAGQLPAGLTLDSTSGLMTGTPAQSGRWDIAIRVRSTAMAQAIGEPQAYTLSLQLKIAGPLTGSVAGLTSRNVVCKNLQTLQQVRMVLSGVTAWDCQELGLQSNEGESVQWILIGIRDVGEAMPVAGTVAGIYAARARCLNMTTGQSVAIPLPNNTTSWDCEASGLLINSGDKVRISVVGRAY